MFGTGWSDRLREFDREHGDYVIVNGVKYFADGAMREAGDAPLYAGCLPPTDARELRQRMRIYWQAKLDHALEEFRETKHRLRQLAKAGGLVRDEELAKLKGLQTSVRDCQKQLKSFDEPREGPTPEQVREACTAYNELQAASEACHTAEQRYREKTTNKRLEAWRESYERWQACKAAWDALSEGQRTAVLEMVAEEIRRRQQRHLESIEV